MKGITANLLLEVKTVECRVGNGFFVVGDPGGILPEKLGRGVRPAPQNPYPINMTKICDFPYPIYDLTKNLIPYL